MLTLKFMNTIKEEAHVMANSILLANRPPSQAVDLLPEAKPFECVG